MELDRQASYSIMPMVSSMLEKLMAFSSSELETLGVKGNGQESLQTKTRLGMIIRDLRRS